VPPAVTVSNLSKHFGKHKALNDVSLTVQPGEFVAPASASSSKASTDCALVPFDERAQFLDRQGRVHARVSVDFPREFGCYLVSPLPSARAA
jgi:ABC-type phosphonate transport system ATPase subunit